MLSGAFFDINDADVKADIFRLKNNPDQYDFSDDHDNYNLLLSSGVICEDDDDNKNILTYIMLSNRFDKTDKNLTILPTLDCNLSCNYCFEESNRCAGVMSKEVIEKVKILIKEQYYDKKDFLDLHWFGGEPLLAFSVIKEITKYIQSLNIPFGASIITNGVLLNESKINMLNSLNIKYVQITLDGDKQTHDKKRVFKNGAGTYDIIINNLKKLHELVSNNKDMIVNIRINIDKHNKDQYHQLYFMLKEKFPLFQVYPGIITQYKTCSMTLPCFTDHNEEALFYIEQYEKYGIVHPEFNISIKGLKSCMAERSCTNLIGPNGEMYLCLQDVGNKDAEIGSIFSGKNNLRLISAYTSGNLTFNSDECRECNVLSFCGGGCVNKRYRNKKCGEKHSMCAAYKDQDFFNKYLDLHYEIVKKNSSNNQ